MTPKEIRSQVVRYCQRLDAKSWVANHDGNITVRLPQAASEKWVATPGGRAKGDLSEDDLIEINLAGKRISGHGSVFSESAIHLKVYELRPEVNAVVHAHPPSATAVGCANQEMVTWAIPEAVVSLGSGVPLGGLSLPNSEAFWKEVLPLIPYYDAIMIGGNGVFTWGKTLEQAFLRMELVEHLAGIFLATLPLGGPKLLPIQDVQALLKKRLEAGLGLPPDPARPHWLSG